MRDIVADGVPSAGEKSTVLPVDTLQADNATGVEETRSLLEDIGAAQTSIVQTSDATVSARDGYHARFTSLPLAAGTFGSGSWTIALGLQESNNQANAFTMASIYFWNGSSVVGFVYDSHTSIGGEWANIETGKVNTITGSNVTIADGDVLVIEFWRSATQAMATARTLTLFYDGATDPTDTTTTTDAASYLQAPADIPLFVPQEIGPLIINADGVI